MIEESTNFEITQEESKVATVDPLMEIYIEKLNHAKEFYVEAIQDLDVFYKDLVSYEDKKLVDLKIASEIMEQEDILDRDDSLCFGIS